MPCPPLQPARQSSPVSKPKTHAVTKITPSNWAPTKQHRISDPALTKKKKKKTLRQYFSDKANSDEAPNRSSTPASQSSLKKNSPLLTVVPTLITSLSTRWFSLIGAQLLDKMLRQRKLASLCAFIACELYWADLHSPSNTGAGFYSALFEWYGLALRNSCWSMRRTFQRNN